MPEPTPLTTGQPATTADALHSDPTTRVIHKVNEQPDRPRAIVPHGEVTEVEGPEHIHLPDPSIFPLILAIGIAIMLFGIPFINGLGWMSLMIILPGITILAVGLGGWLLEDMHNAHKHYD